MGRQSRGLSSTYQLLLPIVYFFVESPSAPKKYQTTCKSREKAWYYSAQESLHWAPNCLDTFARFVTSQTTITYPIQYNMVGKHMS